MAISNNALYIGFLFSQEATPVNALFINAYIGGDEPLSKQ